MSRKVGVGMDTKELVIPSNGNQVSTVLDPKNSGIDVEQASPEKNDNLGDLKEWFDDNLNVYYHDNLESILYELKGINLNISPTRASIKKIVFGTTQPGIFLPLARHIAL